jgi:hypothetical protein
MSEQPTTTGRDRAHEEFVHPGPLPVGADARDAEARLLAGLERELGVTLAPAPARARPSRVRPLLSLAAVILAAAGLLWSQDALRRKREGPLLRGAPPAAQAPGAWAARPLATPLGHGRVRLAWSPAANASNYSVTFLAEDLRPLARVDSLLAPGLVLDRAALPAGLVPGQTVLWRVTARAGHDELARSTAAPLTLP